MFGRPKQSVESWEEELSELLRVCDDHVSLYQLTLERGTQLFGQVERGEVTLPAEEATAEMYQRARAVLHQRGFLQYEVSNFARNVSGTDSSLHRCPSHKHTHTRMMFDFVFAERCESSQYELLAGKTVHWCWSRWVQRSAKGQYSIHALYRPCFFSVRQEHMAGLFSGAGEVLLVRPGLRLWSPTCGCVKYSRGDTGRGGGLNWTTSSCELLHVQAVLLLHDHDWM